MGLLICGTDPFVCLLDPLFVCLFFGGILLNGVMTIDANLFRSTRWKTFLMCAAYLCTLLFLYSLRFCGGIAGHDWCIGMMTVREDIVSWLGRDLLSVSWLLLGFVSFNLDLSGTESKGWTRLADVCLVGFGVLFAVRFLAKLPSPVGPYSVPAALVLGVLFLLAKGLKKRRKPKEKEKWF